VKDIARALLGAPGTWNIKRKSQQASADFPARMRDALAWISAQARTCDAQPIFLLSAGWRSGSTLLQRMIMKHNESVLIWGEPFDHSNIHDGMMNQFRAFTDEWPYERFFLSHRKERNLADEWVANLYPDVEYLVSAHRKYFDCLFGEPARALGRSNWGIKEVRLTIDHALYFRALYPRCKILFLYRNPRDAYLSYRNLDAGWFRSWPNEVVNTPYAFGRHWAATTRGFIDGCRTVDGLLVRYEDLDNPADVARIEKYLGWVVSRSSSLERRNIGASQEKKVKLPRSDRIILDFSTRRTRRDAGY
jgi:hypothetical protein